MRDKIQSGLPLPVHFARKHFEAKMRRLKVGPEKCVRILKHIMATSDERKQAEQHLRTAGWSDEQISAAAKR
jgi:hypothetical protein